MEYLAKLMQEFDIYHQDWRLLYKYAVDNYVAYYTTPEDYEAKQSPGLKRKVMYWLTFVLWVGQMIKYSMLTLYDIIYQDDKLIVMFGEYEGIYVTNRKLFGAMIAICAGCLIITKSIIYLLETRFMRGFCRLLLNMVKSEAFFRLSPRNQTKLMVQANLLYYLYLKLTFYPLFLYGWIVLASLAFMTYFTSHYEFNLAIIIINGLVFTPIFIMNWMSLISAGMVFGYLSLMFLSYKLDDIIHEIRINAIWHDRSKIIFMIGQYNQYVSIIRDISLEMNLIVGSIIILTPYLFTMFIETIRQEQGDIFKIIIALVCFAAFTQLLIINAFCASITTRNQSISKYLYPVLINRNKRQVIGFTQIIKQFELINSNVKISSFIEQLDEQFVGFSCFNLFEFTKLTFYEYLFAIFSTYCLSVDLISDEYIHNLVHKHVN